MCAPREQREQLVLRVAERRDLAVLRAARADEVDVNYFTDGFTEGSGRAIAEGDVYEAGMERAGNRNPRRRLTRCQRRLRRGKRAEEDAGVVANRLIAAVRSAVAVPVDIVPPVIRRRASSRRRGPRGFRGIGGARRGRTAGEVAV